jgi:hypothetical protein
MALDLVGMPPTEQWDQVLTFHFRSADRKLRRGTRGISRRRARW